MIYNIVVLLAKVLGTYFESFKYFLRDKLFPTNNKISSNIWTYSSLLVIKNVNLLLCFQLILLYIKLKW